MNYFYIYDGIWYVYDLYNNPYKTILKRTMTRKVLKYVSYTVLPYTYKLIKGKNNKIKDIEMDKIKYV